MPSAAAPSLDLSRLPPPLAVTSLDYEELLAARIADLRARWPAFDALVESDPALRLQEVDAYRELLALGRINDAVRAGFVAFAIDADLDHLGAFHALVRHELVAADGDTPAVMESDADFRRRILLASETLAASGPPAAWVAHSLAADPRVHHADVWSSAPGQVDVAIQARPDLDGD